MKSMSAIFTLTILIGCDYSAEEYSIKTLENFEDFCSESPPTNEEFLGSRFTIDRVKRKFDSIAISNENFWVNRIVFGYATDEKAYGVDVEGRRVENCTEDALTTGWLETRENDIIEYRFVSSKTYSDVISIPCARTSCIIQFKAILKFQREI